MNPDKCEAVIPMIRWHQKRRSKNWTICWLPWTNSFWNPPNTLFLSTNYWEIRSTMSRQLTTKMSLNLWRKRCLEPDTHYATYGGILYLYLAITKEAMSFFLIRELNFSESPIYLISKALMRGEDTWYKKIEKNNLSVSDNIM